MITDILINMEGKAELAFNFEIGGDLLGAIHFYEEALAENNRDWDAPARLALLYFEIGKIESGVDVLFNKLVNENYSVDSFDKKPNDKDRVAESIEKLLDYEMNNEKKIEPYKFFLVLGHLLIVEGDLETAEDSFNSAIEINAHSIIAHRSLASIKGGMGDQEKKIECLRKAIELDPTNHILYLELVWCYERLILEEFENGLKACPNNPRLTVELGRYYTYSVGRAKDAIDVLEGAHWIQNRFENAWAKGIIGHAYLQTGQIDNAISSLNKALTIGQDFAHIHKDLSMCYLSKGELKKAIDELKKALSLMRKTDDGVKVIEELLSGLQRIASKDDGCLD